MVIKLFDRNVKFNWVSLGIKKSIAFILDHHFIELWNFKIPFGFKKENKTRLKDFIIKKNICFTFFQIDFKLFQIACRTLAIYAWTVIEKNKSINCKNNKSF